MARLAETFTLMLITKGDLMDQERKISLSGLAGYFRLVEIVSDKTPEVYQAVLSRHQIPAERFLMVGNSLRSDILPGLKVKEDMRPMFPTPSPGHTNWPSICQMHRVDFSSLNIWNFRRS